MNQPIKPPQEASSQTTSQRGDEPFGGPPKPRSAWRLVATFLVLLLIVAGIVWWSKQQAAPEGQGRGGRNAAPMSIVPETVGKGDIGINLNALGTVTSLATVTIRSQISGYLLKIDFKEGDEVKKGDLLAEIDPRPYEATLAQANGNLTRDQALLKGAQVDLTRYQGLAAQNAVPRQTLDTQVALVAQYQGTVEADTRRGKGRPGQSAILPHPVAARWPRRPAPGRPGQLRHAGRHQRHRRDHAIAADQRAVHGARRQSAGHFETAAEPARFCRLPHSTAAAPDKIADGTLQTFDSQIDPTTGTIKLRAQFPNETKTLYPNQFVNVQLLLDTHKDVTTMPTAGVQRGVPGTFVYLVNADNTVSVRKVELGVTDGDRVEVRSGLHPGDRIVVDGADKLRDGAKINVRAEATDPNAPPASRHARQPEKPAGGNSEEAAGNEQNNQDRRTKAMSPSQPFILRPVATTLLMIAIMLSGMLAFRFLPVAALPEVDYPTIQVQTFYPGASPDVMTSSVTAPLEVQFGQMPNLNQMSSVSSAGASVITLQFGLTISLDVAEQEVQAAINAAGNLLPSDLPAPPIYAKVNPADAPILTLGLTSKTMPLTQVEDFVDTRLAQKISQLPGVGLVSISGGQRPGGAHSRRHPQARRLRAEHRRSAHHARQRQHQHAEGQFRRADARLHHQRQRPDPECQRLQVADRRLQERLAGAAQRCRRCRRRRRRTTSSAPG